MKIKIISILAMAVLLATLASCGRNDAGSKNAPKNRNVSDSDPANLSRRIDILEQRVERLEKGSDGPGQRRKQGGGDYMQASPKDLAETPELFEGKKIKLAGKLKSMDKKSNKLILTRGGKVEITVDFASASDEIKQRILAVPVDEENPHRIQVFGTFANGIVTVESFKDMGEMNAQGLGGQNPNQPAVSNESGQGGDSE